MNKRIILILVFFMCSFLNAEPLVPYAKNALSANGSGDNASVSVSIDSESNVYYTGTFEGTADFGEEQLTSSGNKDLFIAKTDSSGNFIWVEQAGGVDYITPKSIIIDDNDNLYLTGIFSGSADFGSENIVSEGAWDAFLVKYDSDGNCNWAVNAGSSDSDYGQDIAFTSDGSIVLIGVFQETIDFGNSISLTTSAFQGSFVSVYSSDGVCQWASQINGGMFDFSSINSIAVSSSSIIVSGNFAGQADFGNSIELVSEGNLDVFIAEYNSSGTCQWAKRVGGANYSDVAFMYDLLIDENADIYISGFFEGDMELDANTTFSSNGNEDLFLLKFDSNGDFLWGNAYGSTEYDAARSIAKGDFIYLGGSFSNDIEFDSETTLTSNGDNDIFIALFDTDGVFYGAYSAGSTQQDELTDMISDENNLGYITGKFDEDISFGNGINLTNQGNSDAFFVKMNLLPVIISTIDYDLSPGWNYISANVIADDTDISSVFNSITDNIVIVTDNFNNIYIPSMNINTIGTYSVDRVYSVYSNSNVSFSITGEQIMPEDYTFNLDEGWNYIPYLRSNVMPPATAFDSIINDIVIITDSDGNFFIPDSFDTIENLQIGKGYKIYLKNQAQFTYPNN